MVSLLGREEGINQVYFRFISGHKEDPTYRSVPETQDHYEAVQINI